MPGGDRGLVSWPARSQEFRDNIDVTVGIGERLGCRAFNALYGNRVDGATPPRSRTSSAPRTSRWPPGPPPGSAAPCWSSRSAAPERYPLLTAADALAVIDRVAAAPNVGLLADLYHLAVNGDDVDEVIADHADRIAHVQIADAPGRNEPGTGTLPLRAAARRPRRPTGYAGWVGLEYKPAGASADSFGWLPRERRDRCTELTHPWENPT